MNNKKNEMIKNSMFKVASALAVIVVMAVSTISCNNCSQKSEKTVKVTDKENAVVMEDIWIIGEYKINDIPLTSEASTKSKSKKTATGNISSDRDQEYEVAKMQSIKASFVEQKHEIVEDVVIDIVPIEETQTVFSMNKHGKNKGTIQVISVPGSDEVEQIIFVKGKHKDIYNVSAGMSGKEVRKLRKEMKHMVKHGQVFLYSESSNIMYLMDDKISEDGVPVEEDITIEEVEEMDVQAIIWKDKKHHKRK